MMTRVFGAVAVAVAVSVCQNTKSSGARSRTRSGSGTPRLDHKYNIYMPIRCSFRRASSSSSHPTASLSLDLAASSPSSEVGETSAGSPPPPQPEQQDPALVSFPVELVNDTKSVQCHFSVTHDGFLLRMPNNAEQSWPIASILSWGFNDECFYFSFRRTEGRTGHAKQVTHKLGMKTAHGKEIADACMAAATNVVETLIDEELFSGQSLATVGTFSKDDGGSSGSISSTGQLPVQIRRAGEGPSCSSAQTQHQLPSERGYGAPGEVTDRRAASAGQGAFLAGRIGAAEAPPPLPPLIEEEVVSTDKI